MVPVGYESWDGAINGIYACVGTWRGVPYVNFVKKRNLGKRDELILVRTLLYKYQMRHENPESSMGDDFFRWFCELSETLKTGSISTIGWSVWMRTRHSTLNASTHYIISASKTPDSSAAPGSSKLVSAPVTGTRGTCTRMQSTSGRSVFGDCTRPRAQAKSHVCLVHVKS